MKKKMVVTSLLILAIMLALCGCVKTPSPTEESPFEIVPPDSKTEITGVKITFDGNGGYAPEGITVSLSDGEDTELPAASREGYHFRGWAFEPSGEEMYSARAIKEKKVVEITLYAIWEQYMENEKITVGGVNDGKATVNPTFDWENVHNDTAFSLRLIKDGKEIETSELTVTHYAVTSYLACGSSYTVTATGQDSGFVYKATFETCIGSDADYAEATISLSDPFDSHMVIQRGKPVVLSGKTNPNVTVTATFKGTNYYGTSDASGAFSVTLPAQAANKTPSEIEVRVLPSEKVTLTDLLFGDVFLASGQSNMWWKLRDSDYDTTLDVDNAVNNDMRYYSMKITKSTTPRENITNGKWSAISRSNTAYKDYSAIAFMTGSMVAAGVAEQGVPIGIIQSAEGDTNIANWLGSDYYSGSVATKSVNYNAMIYPLRHTELTGVIWYQGCNNSAKGCEYEELLKSLFENWRELFRNETLPFYVVQLPVYDDSLAAASGRGAGNPYEFSYVRESQLLACKSDANAYLIATCDGGDPNYIHPTEKRYIAERLSKSILATLYGAPYLPQGPIYESHVTEGNKAIVTVAYGEGLHADGAINGFMLAGGDGKYYDASATIENGKIVVTSAQVARPMYVKYGFSKCPFLNIYNKDGYLMSPFRTDNRNVNVDLLDYRGDPEGGKTYSQHPDGSAMSYETVTVDGETGLRITKADDGKSFGSLQLVKLGAIAYRELDLDLTLTAIGTNSGAKVSFRVVEGSYEIWSYTFTDDFTGKREFVVSTADMTCAGNLVDGTIDFQAVRQVELTVTHGGGATVTILGVVLTNATRTAPRAFTLREARNDGREATVKYTRAGFADSYRVIVSADAANYSAPVYDETVKGTQVTFDPACLAANTIYYVKVVAKNELGETVARESGMPLATLDRFVVAEMSFADDDAFDTFAAARLKVKSTLQASRSDRGLKVNVAAKDGWAFCILNFEEGANVGYNTLKFYADFTEYAGDYVCIQFQNAAGDTSYSYNFYYKSAGFVEIPFSSFKKSGEGMGDTSMAKIAFNLVDYTNGGESDNIYIKNVEFLKK